MAQLKKNHYRELYRSDTDTPSIDAMMREVLHMLGNIDFEYEVELDKADLHASSEDVKEHIKKRIRAAHHERREPYVELLTILRQQQHRLALAA